MKLASVLAAIAITAQAAYATDALNTTNVSTDLAVDAAANLVPAPDAATSSQAEVSYPDEDCPNPKKVPHCCAHVRFRNKVARGQNCHAIVKQPGTLEGIGTACARTTGWMALCCKPKPRRKKYTCEAPRRGFWRGSPQYPDRGHSSPNSAPSEADWPMEAETGATFQDDPAHWLEESDQPGRPGPRPGSRQGSRGWTDSEGWPSQIKYGPSYGDGPREWEREEEYTPRINAPRPWFGDESVSRTEADDYHPRVSGQGPGLREGNRWSEDGYPPRERAGSRFRDDSSDWSEPDLEAEEYRPKQSEDGPGFRDWPRWTEDEYKPKKFKSKPGPRWGRGRGRSRKTGSSPGSRGGRYNSDVDGWE